MVLEGAVAPFKEPKVMRMTAALRDQNSRGQLTEAAGPRSGAPGDGATEPRAAEGAPRPRPRPCLVWTCAGRWTLTTPGF